MIPVGPGIKLPDITFIWATAYLEGSGAVQTLLEVTAVIVGVDQGIAINTVGVVKDWKATLEIQIEAKSWAIEGDPDFLQGFNNFVGQEAITPGSLIRIFCQRMLVSVLLLDTIYHVERFETPPPLIG